MVRARSLSLDALVTDDLFAADRTKPVPRRAAKVLIPTSADANSADRAEHAQEAQRYRGEWRRQRYSRLKP
jgi:hypothetical protein